MSTTWWVKVKEELPTPKEVKEYPIVVVKNQNLSNEELVKFASTLGLSLIHI